MEEEARGDGLEGGRVARGSDPGGEDGYESHGSADSGGESAALGATPTGRRAGARGPQRALPARMSSSSSSVGDGLFREPGTPGDTGASGAQVGAGSPAPGGGVAAAASPWFLQSGASWEQVKVNAQGFDHSPPGQRSLHVAVVHQQSLYMFGGYDGSGRVNQFHRFDFVNMTWHCLDGASGPSSSAPSARDRHSGVVVGDFFLVFGGFDGLCRVNDLHAYDLVLNRWALVEKSSADAGPSARHSHSAVAYGGSMYVFGGYDGGYKNDLYEFKLSELGGGASEEQFAQGRVGGLGEWRKVNTSGRSPQTRYRASCVAYENQMFLFGGHDGQKHLNCTHVFNFDTESWSSLRVQGPVPLPRDSHVALVYADAMFIFGGSSGNAMNDFHYLSLRGEYTWRPVQTDGWFPCPRFCHVGVEYDNSMYVYGGYDGFTRLKDFHRFKFAPSVCRVERSMIFDELAAYVETEELSDVVFRLDSGLRVPAHKVFCARCSSLLDGVDAAPCDERGRPIVAVPGCARETFASLLLYLYTDKVRFSKPDVALEIFPLAERFGVERLRKICLNYVSGTLTVRNAPVVLQAADQHAIAELRARALTFILQNFDEVSKTAAFEEMGRSKMDLVFEVLRKRGEEDRANQDHNVVPEIGYPPAGATTGASGGGAADQQGQGQQQQQQQQLGKADAKALENAEELSVGKGRQWRPVQVSAEDFDADGIAIDSDHLHMPSTPPPPPPPLSSSSAAAAARSAAGAGAAAGSPAPPPLETEDGAALEQTTPAVPPLKNPSKRSLHVVAVYDDALYVFGGYTGERRVNDFFKFSFTQREWSTVPVLHTSEAPPTPRDRHTGVVVADRFWVFAGYDGRSRTNQLHSYDFRKRVWQHVPPQANTPSVRHSHCAAASGDSMYVFGGYDGSYKNDLVEFDTREIQWVRPAVTGKAPSARYRATLVAHQSNLYLFGGHDGFRHLQDVHVFSVETRHWSVLNTAAPIMARDSHVSVVHGQYMYVFGGSSGNAMNDFYKLRLKDGGHWQKVHTTGMVPSPRFCHAAAVHGRTLYVYGGYDGVQRLDDFIEWSFAETRISLVPRSTFVNDLAALVCNDRCSDVVFVVEGRRVPAHKVLCMRCPYFRAMFTAGMRESRAAEITFPDIRYKVFVALLAYLYTDRQEIALDMAMELFVCADRFGVERLKSMCENRMLSSINIDNVSHFFAASECHSTQSLHERCLAFIVANFDVVSKTQAFEDMTRSNVELIFQILRAR